MKIVITKRVFATHGNYLICVNQLTQGEATWSLTPLPSGVQRLYLVEILSVFCCCFLGGSRHLVWYFKCIRRTGDRTCYPRNSSQRTEPLHHDYYSYVNKTFKIMQNIYSRTFQNDHMTFFKRKEVKIKHLISQIKIS